jgi:cytochrome P450
MVLNEVMRLFPVAPYVFRKTNEEITIENVTIPNNTSLLISILHIHRNPLYWGKDAHLFKPERFDVEKFEKIHPYAFIPFTKGPRMCLGWHFAILLLKTVLANFLMRFEVDTEKKFEDIELTLGCTMTIHGGYGIRISERKVDSK